MVAIINSIDANDAVEILMQQRIKEFASLIPSDGVGVWVEGVWTYLGSVFASDDIPTLLSVAQSTANPYDVWETPRLGFHLEETDVIGRTVAGALVIPISLRPATYLIYFRSERAHEIELAGNPLVVHAKKLFFERQGQASSNLSASYVTAHSRPR